MLSTGKKQAGYIHTFIQSATPIATQVKDQTLHSLLTQVSNGIANLTESSFSEGFQIHISHSFLQHAIITHIRHLYGLTCQMESEFLLASLHLYVKRCSCIATEHLTHLVHRHIIRVIPIHLQEDVSWQESCLLAGCSLIGLTYHGTLLLAVVPHQAPYAGIFACRHLSEFVVIIREIVCKGIHLPEHGAYAPPDDRIGIQCIHIEEIQLLIDISKEVQIPAGHGIPVLLSHYHGRTSHQHSYIYIMYTSHHFIILLTCSRHSLQASALRSVPTTCMACSPSAAPHLRLCSMLPP